MSRGAKPSEVYKKWLDCVTANFRTNIKKRYDYYQTDTTTINDIELLKEKHPETAKEAKDKIIKRFEDILEKLKKEDL